MPPTTCRKFQKYSTRYLSYVYGIKHVTNHMSKISKIFDTTLAICIRDYTCHQPYVENFKNIRHITHHMYTGLNMSSAICRKFQKYSTHNPPYVYGLNRWNIREKNLREIELHNIPSSPDTFEKKRWSRWCSSSLSLASSRPASQALRTCSTLSR